MSEARTRTEHGFVLIIVLAVLVVLTLLATAVATSAERAIRAAQADADRFQSELAMTGTRETLLFLLATQRQTIAGLTVNESDASASATPPGENDDPDGFTALPVGNEIRLDSTPYQGLAQTRFALQDDRGLLSVNWAGNILRFALYKSLDVPDGDWNGLDAKRLDYQDPDDLHRLNGAEKAQYQREGLPPPTNRTLTTPLELRRIPGWNKILADMDDARLLSTLTLAQTVDLNINTAPAPLLELLPGLSPQNAARMTELRRAAPFLSIRQAQETFGITPVFEEVLSLFAIPSGNLILWDERSGARRLLHWTLTPLETDGPPWRIDYEVTLPRGNESDQAVVGTPQTPLFAQPDQAGERQ